MNRKFLAFCLRYLLLLQVCCLPVAAWAQSGAGGLQRYGNETRVISANLGGDYRLTKVGTGNLTLTGNNTHTGLTRILKGVLTIGNGGATGSLGSGDVDNQSVLVFNLSSTRTFNNAISGTGSVNQNNVGTVTLAGNNTYTGNTLVNQGILQAGIANNAFGNLSAVILGNVGGVKLLLNGFDTTIGSLAGGGTTGGDVDLGANTLTTGDNNATTTYAGYISGSGNLIKNGTGTMTISRSSAYSYGSAVGGTRIGNGGPAATSCRAGTAGSPGGGAGGSSAPAGCGYRAGATGGNGFVVVVFYAAGNIIPDSYDIILTNSTYAVPPLATRVEVWAAGAGGGSTGSQSGAGSVYSGGGGGGGLAYTNANLNGATALTVTIGTSAVGTTGTATKVTFNDVVITANGGTTSTSAWKGGTNGTGGTATVTGTTIANATYKGGNGTSGVGGAGGGLGTTSPTATDKNGIQLATSRINGNTYSGRTTINAGTLLVTHPTSLGWGPITVNAGATLNQSGYTIFNTVTNNGGTVVP